MIDTDLPALARAVAERLAIEIVGALPDGYMILPPPGYGGHVHIKWLWSPDGALWLLAYMEARLDATLSGEPPETVLRAAAAALGVEAR